MLKTNTIQAECEPLLSSHGHHLHIDFGHPVGAHSHLHSDFKKSSSESSEATITDSEVSWMPSEETFDHPPPREMTDSELDLYKPVWVPDPESPTEKDSRPRTLVLCFDGTGDQFDDDVSEILVFESYEAC